MANKMFLSQFSVDTSISLLLWRSLLLSLPVTFSYLQVCLSWELSCLVQSQDCWEKIKHEALGSFRIIRLRHGPHLFSIPAAVSSELTCPDRKMMLQSAVSRLCDLYQDSKKGLLLPVFSWFCIINNVCFGFLSILVFAKYLRIMSGYSPSFILCFGHMRPLMHADTRRGVSHFVPFHTGLPLRPVRRQHRLLQSSLPACSHSSLHPVSSRRSWGSRPFA